MQRRYVPFLVFASLLIITIVNSDYATSVVPGWHTTIFSPFFLINIVAAIIMLLVTIGYLKLGKRDFQIKWVVFLIHLLLTIPAIIIFRFPILFLDFWVNGQSNPSDVVTRVANYTMIALVLFVAGQVFFAVYFFKSIGPKNSA